MAYWKDSTVWYKQQKPKQEAIGHSRISRQLFTCLRESWIIAKSGYLFEMRKNRKYRCLLIIVFSYRILHIPILSISHYDMQSRLSSRTFGQRLIPSRGGQASFGGDADAEIPWSSHGMTYKTGFSCQARE